MKKLYFLLLAAALLCVIGCKKEAKPAPEPEPEPVILWNYFTYPEFNAHIYLKLENEKVDAVACGSANKIVGRIHYKHDCTEAQFETIKKKLEAHGAKEEEPVAEPVVDGYPDMTGYLSFFVTKDQLEEVWKSLAEE